MTSILKGLPTALFISFKITDAIITFSFYSSKKKKKRSSTFQFDDPKYNCRLDDLDLFFYLSLPVLHSI